jgi:hypothetical protein
MDNPLGDNHSPFCFMKKLNKREKDVALVASDLFRKGSPEWRIAQYAHLKGFTVAQLYNFLDKLESVIPSHICNRVMSHFKDIQRKDCFDESIKFGLQVRCWHDTQA